VRLLLDTHVLLWWLGDDRRLKTPERHVIADAEALVHVSAVTVWEIAIKKGLGRIEVDTEALERELKAGAMVELPIRWRHARAVTDLPRHHDDPFDRLLLAQAQIERLVIVSYDKAFRRYDVPVLPSVRASV
jgi:PIN domain nuclease of toxin-antitoxin system